MELLVNYLKARMTWREQLDRELQAQIRLIKNRIEQLPKSSKPRIALSAKCTACERLRAFNGSQLSFSELERLASSYGVKLHNLSVKHPW